MPTFDVSMLLPESFDDNFIDLIPRHQNFINRLLNEKVVETYVISSDRSGGWFTPSAATMKRPCAPWSSNFRSTSICMAWK